MRFIGGESLIKLATRQHVTQLAYMFLGLPTSQRISRASSRINQIGNSMASVPQFLTQLRLREIISEVGPYILAVEYM
jgi:hypothetical protein